MRINILRIHICLLFVVWVTAEMSAQDSRLSFPDDEPQSRDKMSDSKTGTISRDTIMAKVKTAYVWNITPRFGDHQQVARDTSRIDIHRSTLVESKSLMVDYLGNIGSPMQSKIYFERPEESRFLFETPFSYWRKSPLEHLYFNTKIPYTHILYQSGGGARNKEERLMGEMSINLGKKLNIGANVDYLYARGFYKNLYNKHIDYDFNVSYIDDKYKMHLFFGHNKFDNAENGGLSNLRYITRPDDDDLSQTMSGSLDYPVRIEDPMWNRLRGTHFFMSNRYDIGDNLEQYLGEDSVMRWRRKENYVAPASVILTTHYQDQRRRIKSNSSSMDTLYRYYTDIEGGSNSEPQYGGGIDDFMSYYSLKNTLALSMNEGFKPWMKFGLAAFVEYDARKYLSPPGGSKTSNDALFIGGQLTSSKNELLRYKALFEKDLLNSDMGLEGEASTTFKIKNKSFAVRANAYYKKRSPSFFEENFYSKYWAWQTEFKDTERVYLGGEIESSSTGTKISAGVENIENKIYYGSTGMIAQKESGVQVISARLDQSLRAGIFHWDNSIVYQHTGDAEVIPLPQWTFQTNAYLLTRVAKVLSLQLGADLRMHTKYYLPGYEPLTMQFYNQREQKMGNYPMVNVYANFKIKEARFFVMLYNAMDSAGDSFSAYRYPINPRMIKFGLSWTLNN